MRPPRSHSPPLRPASWQRRRRPRAHIIKRHRARPTIQASSLSAGAPGESLGRADRARRAAARLATSAPRVRDRPLPGADTRHRAGGGRSQRRLVLGAAGVARQRGCIGERQALMPENADRVIVAGERVARGERGAGEKAGFFAVFRQAACPGPARERRDRRRRGHGDSRAGPGRVGAGAALLTRKGRQKRRGCGGIKTSDKVQLPPPFLLDDRTSGPAP